jgi:hypothetical protein
MLNRVYGIRDESQSIVPRFNHFLERRNALRLYYATSNLKSIEIIGRLARLQHYLLTEGGLAWINL